MTNQQLTVVARILAKEESLELVKGELIKLIAPSRTDEGCIDYDLHQDNENPNLFLFYENWENRELWQAHMNTPHVVAFGKAIEGAVQEVVLHEMTPIG